MSKNNRKRLLELDALRGLAAIGVVLFHKTFETVHKSQWLNLGLTGVDLFFIISGFVIFMTMGRVKSLKEFIIARITRLYPLYWVAVLLTFTTLLYTGNLVFGSGAIKQLAANLTMFQNYFMQKHLDGVYWTLTVEMLFYLIMATLYSCKKLDKVELWGGIALIPLLIYGLFISQHFGVWRARIHRFASVIEYLPLFLAGIVYYKLKFESQTPFRYILLVACFVTQIALFHLGVDRVDKISIVSYTIMLSIFNGLFLLYAFDQLSWLGNRVLVFFGVVSYPVYLIHNSLGVLIGRALPNNYNFWLNTAVNSLLIIIAGYLLVVFVEKPFIKYVKEKTKKGSTGDVNIAKQGTPVITE